MITAHQLGLEGLKGSYDFMQGLVSGRRAARGVKGRAMAIKDELHHDKVGLLMAFLTRRTKGPNK